MENTKLDLIGVGNPLMDVLARVEPEFIDTIDGEKGGMVLVSPDTIVDLLQKIGGAVEHVAGGSAGNTTFAAARMGLKTTYLGKVGKDEVGKLYMQQFAAYRGQTNRFKFGEIPTGTCLSMITPDGERTLRTDLGAAATLTAEDITPLDFENCRHAHIEGYLLFNPELFEKIVHSAKEAGCTVSLDLASFEVVNAARDLLQKTLRNYVDILIANEDEAAAFLENKDPLESQALQLLAFSPIAIVKGGATGSYVASENKVLHAKGIPGIQAVDTTGAGDIWAAGFLYGWLSGQSFEDSANLGNRIGAEIVQNIGAKLKETQWDKLGF